MAKYKDIGGTAIQSRSGAEEYTYPSPEGELFYNAGNGQFQFVGLGGGNWATGGNMNQARYAAGSVQKGAKRMYDTMKNLEAKPQAKGMMA